MDKKFFPKVITMEHVRGIQYSGITGCTSIAYGKSEYDDCEGTYCNDTCVFSVQSFNPDILIEYVLKNKIATKAEILDLQLKGVFNKGKC